MHSAVRVLANALEHLGASRRHDDWTVPRGVAPVQVFLSYIIHSLAYCIKDAWIYTELAVVTTRLMGLVVAEKVSWCGHGFVASGRLLCTRSYCSAIQHLARLWWMTSVFGEAYSDG